MKDKKGFTIIELLVVVTIIGILAAVGITAYAGVQNKARRSEAYSNLQNLRLLEEQIFADNGFYFPNTGAPQNHPNNPVVNAGAIQAIIPNFRPGGNPIGDPVNFGLLFNYQLQSGIQITAVNPGGVITVTTAAIAAGAQPCFVATATALHPSLIHGGVPEIFAIDCNNVRNFE